MKACILKAFVDNCCQRGRTHQVGPPRELSGNSLVSVFCNNLGDGPEGTFLTFAVIPTTECEAEISRDPDTLRTQAELNTIKF